MTRDEAVTVWLICGSRRVEEYFRRRVPEHIADAFLQANAEDVVDGMIALGLLKIEQQAPRSSQETE